ncbi:MAG: hypothetical protein AB7F86_20300 [Bdellovibrionales bacterium]
MAKRCMQAAAIVITDPNAASRVTSPKTRAMPPLNSEIAALKCGSRIQLCQLENWT